MPVPARDTDCGLPTASSVMFTAAARAPGAAGVKLTPIVQLVPGATEPAPVGQVLPAAKAKSAACAPVMVMPVRFSGAPPLLVSVTFCAALVVPTRCSPNALLVAESVAVGGVTPVPVSDTDCGLPAASSVMVSVAVRALAAVGVKVRLRTQLAPAASVAPLMQVVPEASAKSPALAPPSTAVAMLGGAVPLLVRVTVCPALVVPTRWLPSARHVAERVTAGAVPVPVSDTVCGLPAASSVMFTVAARAPGAAGVNVNVKVQLADAATDPPASGQGVVPEPATAKSPGLAPARVMLVRLSVAVPPLVRVTVWARPLVVPTRWLPKATLFADNVTAGAMPVPVRVIVCGLPGASSTMFSVALRIPVASGVKLTLIVQLAPGATEPAPVGQVLSAAMPKSAACAPVMVVLGRLRGAPPLLVGVA